MATPSQPFEVMGFRKRDVDKNWAEFVARVNYLHKPRDEIRISYPNKRNEALVIYINDEPIYTELLPGSIKPSDCGHKVKDGKRGEVKVKLRKSEPEDWMDRWSLAGDAVQQQQQPAVE